jgi:hypothetical protein
LNFTRGIRVAVSQAADARSGGSANRMIIDILFLANSHHGGDVRAKIKRAPNLQMHLSGFKDVFYFAH